MHLLSVFSLRNRALIALLTIVIGIFGGIALTSQKLELFPEISLPQVNVTATYPGASPAVVENDVATPIESALQGIEGLTSTSATSSSGLALVVAEFDYDSDLVRAEQRVQLAINRIAASLPEGVEPQVSTFSLGDFPVIQLAVTSDLDPNALTARLESIAVPELQAIEGVREASVSGGSGQRVTITPDLDALEDYHLSNQSIANALQSNGDLLAIGDITENGETLTVQSGTRITEVEQIAELPVLGGFETETVVGPGGVPTVVQDPVDLTIADIAEVELVANPIDSISRVDGETSLTLGVTKKSDANTVDVSHAVEEALDEIADQVGSNTEFTVVFDQAPSVERSIDALVEEGLLGLVFAVLVILVFLLSVRSTLVTAVSIPVSVLITFIGMWATGYSLNTLTLGAITISIGRVVDDSIVVIENIKRHLALGDDKMTAIKTGVREVATAVTASTVVTVAVFLPIALVGDLTGELFRPFALTVTIALLASLFVSLTIVPVLAYWFLGSPKKRAAQHASAEAPDEAPATTPAAEVAPAEAEHRGQHVADATHPATAATTTDDDELQNPSRMQKAYLPIIRWTLRHPVVTLLASLLLLGGTLATVPMLQTNFIGDDGSNTITVTQKLEQGADLTTKDEAAAVVERALLDVPGVETVQLSIGGEEAQLRALFGTDVDATFSITTDPDGDQEQITADVRDAVESLSDAGEITVGGGQSSFASSDIEIVISAGDDDALTAASDAILDEMRSLDAVAEASSNLAASQPYISIDVDREAAAEEGLTEVTVGRTVADAMQPAASSSFELDDTSVSIYITDPDKPLTLEELRDFELTASDGDDVRLGDIATVEIVDGPTSITTARGVRTATVTVTPASADLGGAGAVVTASLEQLELPDGASATIGGALADQQTAFQQLGLALLAAILIVYTIMVATFRSLRQPLLLLVSIPFAATGVLGLQLISGIPLGAASIIGALMLVGIVVTNAIMLVDLVNQYRERGYRVNDALEHGAARRLRPILMTAAATILALTPMALGITGSGGVISQPLAIVVIGGLISSTVLTLIVLPTLYSLVEGASERRADKRARKEAEREPATAS